MNNFLLQFCYSVEIGAHLAYVGHFRATNDKQIYYISQDELRHMVLLKRILANRGSSPSRLMNAGFFCLGSLIKILCPLTPKPLLSIVAATMELFNILSYSTMARRLPEFKDIFLEMKENEEDHAEYFKKA